MRRIRATDMARLDIAHFGLMGGALGLAYLVPFELLLLAYVVLGPAHYLTEISWLHDRKYFLPHLAFRRCWRRSRSAPPSSPTAG